MMQDSAVVRLARAQANAVYLPNRAGHIASGQSISLNATNRHLAGLL